MDKKPVYFRRIVLVLVVAICIFYAVRHIDLKEYSSGNEQEYINKVCRMSDIPALSVAVWDGENEVFLNYSDGEQTADEHTLYELASTTKAFTGLGILQLEKKGMIDLDDSVQKYIPDFHPVYNGRPVQITIKQLMNHSSGLPVYSLESIPEEAYHKGGLNKSLSCFYNINLSYEPGSKYEYSTVNYDLLAAVIEKVTGQEYQEYIKKNVLDKNGMTESFFRTDAVQENVTPGYKQAFFYPYKYNAPVYYGNTAAGYLISDTSDLMKWIKNVPELFDFESFPTDPENSYFAGWNIYDDYVCHSGNNPNYSSQVYVSRNKPLGVFVLSSENGSSATVIGEGLFRMHQGEKVRIGWFSDLYDTLDLVFILVPLLIMYGICWIPLKSKNTALARLAIGCLFILAFAVFPFVSPIGYRFCFIWYPGSLAFLIGVTGLVSVYLIMKTMIYLITEMMS